MIAKAGRIILKRFIRYFFARCVLVFLLITINPTELISQSGKQSENRFEKEVTLTLSSNYLLYLPADYHTNKKVYPLLLFLHGSGERGTDLNLVKTHGPPKLIEQGMEFPFIIVSPQCPENMFWNPVILSALIDDLEANYRIDKNRIYLTGLSMGGDGTWTLAMFQPDRFAAIAPVCGWSSPLEAYKIAGIPVWAFHGARDLVVPAKGSEDMIVELQKLGAQAKLTIYPDAGHDSWTETYLNDELYKWFMDHSLIEEAQSEK